MCLQSSFCRELDAVGEQRLSGSDTFNDKSSVFLTACQR